MSLQLSGVDAVEHLASGADRPGHTEGERERFHDLLGGGRDDECGAVRVTVDVEQPSGLRSDTAEQCRDDPLVEGLEVVAALTPNEAEDPVARLGGDIVAVITAQLEQRRADRVTKQFAGRHQSGSLGGSRERERGRAADQRSVEIEEGCARTAGRDVDVLAHRVLPSSVPESFAIAMTRS